VQSQGFKAVISGARVLYREPQTLRDFIIQRRRYDANITQLERLFGKEFKEYVSIPIKLWLEFFKDWFRDPIGGTLWILLRGFLKLKAPTENGGIYVTDPAASTKATFGRRGCA
jgi:hypothetical protein